MALTAGRAAEGPSTWGTNFLLGKGANSSRRAAGDMQAKGEAKSKSKNQLGEVDGKAELYKISLQGESFKSALIVPLLEWVEFENMARGKEVKMGETEKHLSLN